MVGDLCWNGQRVVPLVAPVLWDHWCQHFIGRIIARDTIASGIFGGRGDGLHISDLLCLLISGWVGIATRDQHRNPKSNDRDHLVVQSTRGWWESGSMVALLVG